MEKHKFLIIVISFFLSVAIITGSYLIAEARNNNNLRVHKEETNSMYVKINPLVKLTFKDEYSLCKNKKGKKEICGNHHYTVTGFELVNDDAKNIYKGLDLKDKNLYQVLLTLCETASSNKILFNKVEITTDSDTIKNDNILKYLKNNAKNKISYSIYVDYDKHLNEEKVLKEEEEKSEKVTYTVTFDSYGGSNIEAQTIEEGQKATRPANPTRKGYSFIEWQLNGKAFNFNTEITQDITLEAMWQKSKTTGAQETVYDKPPENAQDNQPDSPEPNETVEPIPSNSPSVPSEPEPSNPGSTPNESPSASPESSDSTENQE